MKKLRMTSILPVGPLNWRLRLLLPVLTIIASDAICAPRAALIIGNSEYAYIENHSSAASDAALIKEALEKANFDVTFVQNATQAEMSKAIFEYSSIAAKAEAGWFFYAGHALQTGGENYLIPSDALIAGEAQVKYSTVGLNQVIASMKSTGTPLRVITLDCSGPNPYASSWGSAISPGLSKVEVTEGSIVAFSAMPDQLLVRKSPFVNSLAAAIGVIGQDIKETFKKSKTTSSYLEQNFLGSFVISKSRPIATTFTPNLSKAQAPTITTQLSPSTLPQLTNSEPPPLGMPSQITFAEPLPPAHLIAKKPTSTAPQLLSTTSLDPSSLGGESALTTENKGQTPSLPQTIASPGQPNFAAGKYYRNNEVFNKGPFEKVVSVTVFVQLVKSVQKELFGEERATGWMNSETQIAILELQHKNSIEVSGLIDYRTAELLKLQLPAAEVVVTTDSTPPESEAVESNPSPPELGYNVPRKPGMVYSPFVAGKIIDARGREPGEILTDPHSNRAFQLASDFDSGAGAPIDEPHYRKAIASNQSTTSDQGPAQSKTVIPEKFYNSLKLKNQSESFSGPSEAFNR